MQPTVAKISKHKIVFLLGFSLFLNKIYFLSLPHFFLSIRSQPSSFSIFCLSLAPLFSLFGFMVGILELASAFLVGVEIVEAGPLEWWLFLWLGWVLAGVLWWVLGVEN